MVFTLGLLGEENFATSYLYFDLLVVYYGSTFNFYEKSIKIGSIKL